MRPGAGHPAAGEHRHARRAGYRGDELVQRGPLRDGEGRADRQLHRRQGAHRGVRLHHPLEFPAPSDRRQAGACPGGRLHGGGQAELGYAADGLLPGRDDRGDRRAGRRVQPDHGPRQNRR